MDGTNNLAGGDGPRHDRNMEARVAVLEEIAAATKQGFSDMRRDIQETHRRIDETNRRMDELRADTNRRFDEMRDRHDRDFRLMFGALITAVLGLAALMAKGFHWF